MQHFTKTKAVISSREKPTAETLTTKNSSGWKQIGHYSSYVILAKNDSRRLVDTTTGRIVVEYRISGRPERFKPSRKGTFTKENKQPELNGWGGDSF